jgi:hypothetical protein
LIDSFDVSPFQFFETDFFVGNAVFRRMECMFLFSLAKNRLEHGGLRAGRAFQILHEAQALC